MNLKTFHLLIPVVIAVTACTGTRSLQTSPVPSKPVALLHAEIDSIYQRHFFNGFAVSIVNENGTLYQEGFGLADVSTGRLYSEKTIQNIGSVSKPFVGIALLKAQELGKLNLDDPIEKYLPFRVVNPHFPDVAITIRHLATHTSSIVDNAYYLSENYFLKPNQQLEGLLLQFDDEQVFQPADSMLSLSGYLENVLTKDGPWNAESYAPTSPGSHYEYSNTGTALAALVLERATGISFDTFTSRYILTPLKMNASGWKFEQVRINDHARLYADPSTPLPFYQLVTYPDGGLITSVNDLSLFLSELIRGYKGEGTLLTSDSYAEYFRQQLAAEHFTERNERNPYNESYNVGIFIGFGCTGYCGHTGGDPGVVSMLFFDPVKGIGRIMLFNTTFTNREGNIAFYDIWDALEKYQDQL